MNPENFVNFGMNNGYLLFAFVNYSADIHATQDQYMISIWKPDDEKGLHSQIATKIRAI